MQDLTGQVLGQYELRELIGMGGMGMVYRAYQATLKREVAVKVLSIGLLQQTSYIERFNREAETAAALEHPHIVPIVDYGTQRGISYVVMRLLSGGTLAQRLQQRIDHPQALPSLIEINQLLKQIGSALDYAHEHDVIHRDIKPSNIMFDNQGNAYLVDFGIAKLTEFTTGLTGTGTTMGTPTYMAPEQWKNESITPATDQYAFGIMIYSLITGRVPFEAPTPYQLMHKHLSEEPTPLQVYQNNLPEAVSIVLSKALAKEPLDRFASVTVFAQAFERSISGLNIEPNNYFTFKLKSQALNKIIATHSSRSVSLPVQTQPQRNNFKVVGVIGVIVALLFVAGWILLSDKDKSTNEASENTHTASPIATNEGLTEIASNRTTLSSVATDITAFTSTPEATTAPVIIIITNTETVEPSATPSDTPNLTDTPDVESTNRVITSVFIENLTQTGAAWTETPTRTFTPTRISTFTPSPTSSYTPTSTYTPTFTPSPTLVSYLATAMEAGCLIYLVEEGDTLSSIAGQYNIPKNELALVNGINEGHPLQVGMQIVVGGQRCDPLDLFIDNVANFQATAVAEGCKTHLVQEGDTVNSLAGVYDVTKSDLAELNDIETNTRLAIGEIILIPTDTCNVELLFTRPTATQGRIPGVANIGAELRDGPGENYPLIQVIDNRSDNFTIIARTNDQWYLVELFDGTFGWLNIDDMSRQPTNSLIDIIATIPPTPRP